MDISQELTNAIIEVVETENDKMGKPNNADFVPDAEYVLTAVKHYSYSMAYRWKRNKKDANVIKALDKLPAEQKASILAVLGVTH